jgi:sugar-phosphatase
MWIMLIAAILFDLDGVLVDSSGSVRRCWHRWAKQRSLDPDQTEALAHGRPAREVIERLAPDLDPMSEERRLTRWQLEDNDDVVGLPGASELLSTIRDGAWAIVTSGPRDLALARIRRAGLAVPSVLVTADDVRMGKPSPEGYLAAARRLRASPSSCLVVEDSPVGIAAGKAAGMLVVAIATTFPVEALRDADRHVSTLADIRGANNEDLRLPLGR